MYERARVTRAGACRKGFPLIFPTVIGANGTSEHFHVIRSATRSWAAVWPSSISAAWLVQVEVTSFIYGGAGIEGHVWNGKLG